MLGVIPFVDSSLGSQTWPPGGQISPLPQDTHPFVAEQLNLERASTSAKAIEIDLCSRRSLFLKLQSRFLGHLGTWVSAAPCWRRLSTRVPRIRLFHLESIQEKEKVLCGFCSLSVNMPLDPHFPQEGEGLQNTAVLPSNPHLALGQACQDLVYSLVQAGLACGQTAL